MARPTFNFGDGSGDTLYPGLNTKFGAVADYAEEKALTFVPTAARGVVTVNDDQGEEITTQGGTHPAQRWEMQSGTFASPNVLGGPLFKISKVQNLTTANNGGNHSANEWNAGIAVSVDAAATNEVQAVAGFFAAVSRSTVTAQNDDANAVQGVGMITGSGTGYGIGGYFEGWRNTNTGKTNGLEVRSANYTATAGTYSSSGPSDTMGLWITGSGDSDSAVACAIGKLGTPRLFKVGFAAIAGTVVDQTFRDDSSAITSIDINGSHTDGLDTTGATFSGRAIKLKTGTAAADGIQFGDIDMHRSASGYLNVSGGGIQARFFSYTNSSGGGFFEGVEQSPEPSAPGANTGRLYFKDNGSGKTQLVVRFNTGAIQVLATEP